MEIGIWKLSVCRVLGRANCYTTCVWIAEWKSV